jgi:ABC-2 type transport system permease protein
MIWGRSLVGIVNWIGLFTIIKREFSRFLRAPVQSIIAPFISALLFIFVFGLVVGSRIGPIGGHKYLEFVLPGILLMNVVNAALSQSSSIIYVSRFLRFIDEMLVTPLSYVEILIGLLSAVIVRASVIGFGILTIGIVSGTTKMQAWPMFLFWILSISTVFGLLGFIIGFFAKSFESLSLPTVFFITPLSMMGGVFNTLSMLPPWLRWLTYGNPLFYFISGVRNSMTGFDESPPGLGVTMILLLIAVLSAVTWRIFGKGGGFRQ